MYDIVVQTILVCNVLRTLEKESVYKKSLLVELNTFELLGKEYAEGIVWRQFFAV